MIYVESEYARPKKVVLAAADPVFTSIGEQVAVHGTHVKYIDFCISRSFGGSFRCSTQPLLRKV